MIFEGGKLQKEIINELKQERKKLGNISLAAILVGEDKQKESFLRAKEKAAKELNIEFKIYRFPEDISREKLRDSINQIVKAKVNNGVILQLPLPDRFNSQYFLNAILPEKDVDRLSAKALGDFYSGKEDFLPPSVATTKFILEKNGIDLKGKRAVVFGLGQLVGRPISFWLARYGATVSTIDIYEKNPELISKEADIIVSGVGKKNLINVSMVKYGSVLIDFGGDMEQKLADKASVFTPTPGGTGPVLVAMIMKNLVKLTAFKNQA